ncbi:MAG: hypothetical protein CMO61_03430 [Verrucomicrobiales bacterium]|nr:hypothetical protein [Verrucomicrobiales bacterium]
MTWLAQWSLKILLLPWVKFFYRLRRFGVVNVPKKGGVLLLGNHVSYIDSFVLYLTSPRPIRFVVLARYTQMKAIGWFLKMFGVIPIQPSQAKKAITDCIDALKAGDMVCLFPEGGLTRLGVVDEFKKGFEIIARKSDCQVVPVYMDGLWNSIFSFERGRFFSKRPHGLFCPLQVAYGPAVSANEANTESIREAVMAQSVEAFAKRRDFELPLEKAVIRSLKKNKGNPLFVEYGKKGPRVWTRSQTLGMATAISRRWINHRPDESDFVGVMLPPGAMNAVINLGLFLAGKTPVNLPFTIDQEELKKTAHSIKPLGMKTVITSRAFIPHLIDFWEGDVGSFIDMKSLASIQGSPMGLMERLRAKIEPAWVTCWRLDLNNREFSRQAVGLVPVAGESPILLSSANLHRNAVQVGAADFVGRDDVIFTEDSLSVPEGLTLACWTPLLGKGKVVARSFSLREETGLLKEALNEQEVTLLSGSRNFYAGLGESVGGRMLKYALLFGPVLQKEIKQWEAKLGIPLCRAWSSHGRVATMSRPDPNDPSTSHHQIQIGRLPGAVGRFLPGIAVRVKGTGIQMRFDPVSDDEIQGLWLDGPDQAELDKQGFLSFLAAGSDPPERAKKSP